MTMIRTLLACSLVLAACSKSEPTKPTPPPAVAANRFDIKVTDKGFEPADLQLPAGKPVTLVFERTTDETCAKEVVIPMPDGTKLDKQLPLNTKVEVATMFPTGGKIGYACGMDMVKGTLTVQ